MAQNKIDANREAVQESANAAAAPVEETLGLQLDKLHMTVKAGTADEMKRLKLCQERIQFQEYMKQQLEKVEQEKRFLEAELARAEQTRKTRTDQLQQAVALGQRESNRKAKSIRERERKCKQLEELLHTLPENRRREVMKNVTSAANPPKNSASSSEIEITDSNFSSAMHSSDTDSDDWLLFPELGKRVGNQPPRRNKIFPRRSSTICAKPQEPPALEDDPPARSDRATRWSILDESVPAEGSSASLRSLLPLDCLSVDNSASFFANILEQLLDRQHNFIRQYLVLGEKCLACVERIMCGAKGLKCVDCHAMVHMRCQQSTPKPCIPMKLMRPGHASIGDYCTSFAPSIPAVVVHCVLQIEERGLQTVGLYRIPDLNKTFRSLKGELLRNRGMPNLSRANVTVVCELLKDFLASLRPALIPENIFQKLVEEFERKPTERIKYDDLYNAVQSFPRCNKDTLVFLIIHLQNVSKSSACRMPASSLSKVFTPILVENYKSDLYQEEKRKWGLLERFLNVSSEYWKCILIKDL